MKSETFFLESSEDATRFVDKCKEEGILAIALSPEDHDGRTYYPVKVTFDDSKLHGRR